MGAEKGQTQQRVFGIITLLMGDCHGKMKNAQRPCKAPGRGREAVPARTAKVGHNRCGGKTGTAGEQGCAANRDFSSNPDFAENSQETASGKLLTLSLGFSSLQNGGSRSDFPYGAPGRRTSEKSASMLRAQMRNGD